MFRLNFVIDTITIVNARFKLRNLSEAIRFSRIVRYSDKYFIKIVFI